MPASPKSRASTPYTLRNWVVWLAALLPSLAWAQLVQVDQVSQPAGFVSDTQVVEVGAEVTTVLPQLSSNGYIFGYWKLGEERLADGQGRSVVQPTVGVSAAITLTAHYFLETEDTDGDGVHDWFEWRNFGTLYQGQQDDADGDGFTNGQEDALGQEPTIFDEVEDGGVPARRSPPFTYADTSMVKYTMKSDPLGFVDTTERYVEINGSTTSANLHGESNGYTFAYWSVNGVRQAAGAGVAVSQVTTRVEDTTVAIAHYLPTTEDSDGDGVADWFELNQFGDLNSGPEDDADGDNFTNAQEEALGQEATIRDEVEDGGVTARRSPPITYADTSMVAYTLKSEPAGFVEQSTGYVEQNASITTPNLHGESNGYTFAYWALNGVRQTSPNGLSISQVTASISATSTLIANYLPTTEDSDGDGVEDWFEIYQFGDLGQSPDDDMDGDGFSNRQENELGQEALIIDEVEDGGVTARRSKSVLYFEQQNYAPSGLELNNTITFTNLPTDTLVGGLTPTDLNDAQLEDTYTYSLLTGPGGEDYARYSLSANLLRTANLFSEEANHSLLIRVTDPEGLHFDQNFTIHVLDPTGDPDGDGLSNQEEWIAGTRYDHADSDGDGFSDGTEISAGTNPLDADSFPNSAPTDLTVNKNLIVSENEAVGTIIGEFNASDPEGGAITFHLLDISPLAVDFSKVGVVNKVSPGMQHTLFSTTEGDLYAVGSNSFGQFGIGTTQSSTLPVKVAEDVTDFAAGGHHSLYIDSSGNLFSSGINTYGQLGNGIDNYPNRSTTFSKVAENVISVSAGTSHSLFVKSDNTLWAMGTNRVGQLGMGFGVDKRHHPTKISVNAQNVISVAAGQNHSLFLKTDKTIWGMGYNEGGQISDGSLNNRETAVQVLVEEGVPMAGVIKICADRSSLFLKDDSTAWGMGFNESGQLGNGGTSNISFAVKIAENVKDIATGGNFNLILKSDGTLWGVGSNQSGQLGLRNLGELNSLTKIASNVESIAANSSQSFFINEEGKLFAMGWNSSGQLGNGSVRDTYTPLPIQTAIDSDRDIFNFSDSIFTLETNGTLKTGSEIDYEYSPSLFSIKVQAKDFHDATTEGTFTVLVTNDPADDVAGTFTVSGGQHEFPYFQFTDADGHTPDFSTLRLQKGAIYEFVSSNIASGHTFMIGESYGDTSSDLVTGNTLNSYQNGQKLTLTIPADFSGELYYFCTYHSHMVQPFLVGRPTHTVDLNSTVSLEMVWVEPGTFTMGQYGVAEPEHEVTLTQGFYLGEYEVTQAQYEAVMTGNTEGLSATPSGYANHPNRPVEKVSWHDLQVFLRYLNEQEADSIPAGWAYVLPTEAQWEYACRAGTTTTYSWGDAITSEDANYGQQVGQPSTVGNYAANPWGFFDMHGNVWEWTADAMRSYTTDAQTNPHHPGLTNSDRTVRGGTWNDTAEKLASSFRNRDYPDNGADNRGFRLAFKQVNQAPIELNSTAALVITENQPIGTVVGEFNATDPDGVSKYEIISGVEMSWQEAREDASSRGGHLVTITSQEENNIVTGLLESAGYPDDGPYWIGMHEVGQGGSSAGQFRWVTGEAIDYTNWQASHPEYNGNTRAVYVTTINTNNLGKWYDWRDDPNSKCNGYILELPPAVLYHLVSGEGDGNNSLFTLDQNGTLRTATIFDYENNASTYTIRVQAKDEYNTTVEGNFTVSVEDVFEDLDGDGLEDHLDDDMDGDGFLNGYENEIGSDPMDAQSTPLNFGLVAWYPFDGNASDMSGNGNNGTVYGATLTTDRHGEANRAYSFDGDDWIEAPHFEQLNFSGDQSFTVSVWTKIDPTDASGTILEKWTNSIDPYPFAIRYGLGTGNLSYAAHRSGGGSATAISVYSTNTYREDAYHHLIIVSTETDIKIYQDTILKDSYSFSPNEFANSHKLMFGKREGRTDRSLYGVIDDVRIYNYAFGEKEIRYLYKKESPHYFTDLNSSTDLEMIWVEPGTFTMGQYGVAEPEHEVSLTQGFYLGKYEVTQAQYEAVMSGNTDGLSATPSGYANHPNRPVEKVSWHDLQVFLRYLNEQEADNIPAGWAYVLPTEAQWEYACRAGTTTTYSWGNAITSENANYGQQVGQPSIVGNYAANPWGFFDMHGNVWEWTADAMRSYTTDAQTNPHHPGLTNSDRTVRGGTWNDTPEKLASSFRNSDYPDNGADNRGFRLALELVNQAPIELNSTAPLALAENQPIGTIIGGFNATDPDGNEITFHLVAGENNNSLFTLDTNGTLRSAEVFDFEQNQEFFIRVQAKNESNQTTEKEFIVSITNDPTDDPVVNQPPIALQTLEPLTVDENQPIGTPIGQFTAEDPDGNALTFHFVSGENNNSLFTLDTNGALKAARSFDFEVDGASFTIEVEARDPSGARVAGEFVVTLIDDPEGEIRLVVKNFVSLGFSGRIGTLEVQEMDGLTFQLGPDEFGNLHYFTLSKDGELTLEDELWESGTHTLNILIFDGDELVAEPQITIEVDAPEREDFLAADTTDSAYHESALMIRNLDVVQHNWRNGHNPIKTIGPIEGRDGLFVTTAQPHGRNEGDSVVLSGVKGLQIEGLKNWNFLIDEVNATSFRIRHFGKNANGVHDGSFGQLARAVVGTAYQTSPSDFLLGPWTFGHLLGNMVGEQDDPVTFYKHFANQWKNKQIVNGWPTDDRPNTHNAMVPREQEELTLSNLPFRLLAIGNRIDLFHAKSMRQVADAGEGRFVFTMTQSFPLPLEEIAIWKVHEKTRDEPFYTLIFEYGQPAGVFATLAKWAKDWHMLQRENLQDVDEEYFQRLNDLTDRFSKRGSDIRKPNANPINQVRTNDFIQSPLWQMREFNLVSKQTAHEVKATPERETKLVVDEAFQSIDIGLWTTTTKNNPMVRENGLEDELVKPLARWINQRENYIVGADVGPRAPEWMEGPVANEPGGFSYTFGSEKIRNNLARYKYSLSTCTGCHTGDTGTGFQMVVSSGRNQRAFFAPFMVGNGNGGMHVVNDHENFEEKHTFFDLKGREEIARDILEISQQVDAARLRLTRTEIRFDGLDAPSHVFVSEGILSDWEFELPSGREDNDFYTLNASTGELSLRNNQERPPFGSGKIFLRARATDGTGVVIERPYSLWILGGDEERLTDDLDPTMLPVEVPPFVTPRPNRTH